tara:strand:+ start:86 stop:352 length:267 start_codon:yes stop_codon:yes gene_type:complete
MENLAFPKNARSNMKNLRKEMTINSPILTGLAYSKHYMGDTKINYIDNMMKVIDTTIQYTSTTIGGNEMKKNLKCMSHPKAQQYNKGY